MSLSSNIVAANARRFAATGLLIMPSESERTKAAGIYLGLAAIAHLSWETLQLPLYTIWTSGTPGEIAFAVFHCTAGDVLIATGALIAAIIACRAWYWPRRGTAVAVLTIVFGLAYTAYSEWFNVEVRSAWAYSADMPIVHIGAIKLGLSPLLQWLIVPIVCFAGIRRGMIGKALR